MTPELWLVAAIGVVVLALGVGPVVRAWRLSRRWSRLDDELGS